MSNIEEFERSKDFSRPWRISEDIFWTRYGRRSAAIVDVNNRVVLFLDPSEDEYEIACTPEAAEHIVATANGQTVA